MASGSGPHADEREAPRNGSTHDGRGAAPTDTRLALIIIGGIVVMFLVGFLLLVVSMANDWQ